MLVGGRVNEIPGAEDFGHGPELGDTWSERRLAVKDFSLRLTADLTSNTSGLRRPYSSIARSYGQVFNPIT